MGGLSLHEFIVTCTLGSTMSNTPILSINQSKFPYFKQTISLLPQARKVKLMKSSVLASQETEIDFHVIDTNFQKVRQFALRWMIFFFITAALFMGLLKDVAQMRTLLSSYASFAPALVLIGLAALYFTCWWKFQTETTHETIVSNRFTGKPLFSIHANLPDSATYEEFVANLKALLRDYQSTQSFQSLLDAIPTHILVEEFSQSYLDELLRRGIDVGSLVAFLQMRALDQERTLQ